MVTWDIRTLNKVNLKHHFPSPTTTRCFSPSPVSATPRLLSDENETRVRPTHNNDNKELKGSPSDISNFNVACHVPVGPLHVSEVFIFSIDYCSCYFVLRYNIREEGMKESSGMKVRREIGAIISVFTHRYISYLTKKRVFSWFLGTIFVGTQQKRSRGVEDNEILGQSKLFSANWDVYFILYLLYY